MTKSRRLTTIAEFAVDAGLRPEELAGFKVWLRGTRCAADEKWEELLAQYRSRAIGETRQ